MGYSKHPIYAFLSDFEAKNRRSAKSRNTSTTLAFGWNSVWRRWLCRRMMIGIVDTISDAA